MRTFFLSASQWPSLDGSCQIDGQEAKHISKVLRLKTGEHIQLLDGNGRSGEFEITAIKNNSVSCRPINIQMHPVPSGRAWLAAAYTKAARRSFMLEKAVELEAGGVWFWQAEFSQAKVPTDAKEKWQDELIAGAKQSVNPWLPEIKTMPDGAAEVSRYSQSFKKRFLLWEDAGQNNMLKPEDLSAGEDVLFVMGPEGGLSKSEVDIFTEAGFSPVSLGKRILRWETAAVLCLGLNWWTNEINKSIAAK